MWGIGYRGSQTNVLYIIVFRAEDNTAWRTEQKQAEKEQLNKESAWQRPNRHPDMEEEEEEEGRTWRSVTAVGGQEIWHPLLHHQRGAAPSMQGCALPPRLHHPILSPHTWKVYSHALCIDSTVENRASSCVKISPSGVFLSPPLHRLGLSPFSCGYDTDSYPLAPVRRVWSAEQCCTDGISATSCTVARSNKGSSTRVADCMGWFAVCCHARSAAVCKTVDKWVPLADPVCDNSTHLKACFATKRWCRCFATSLIVLF